VNTQRRAYAAWIAVCLIWGTTYLGIRVALESMPPFLMAAFRWMVGGAVLLSMLKARGESIPDPRSWPGLALLGVLFIGFGNGGVVWAEQTVPSGLTAVLAAMRWWGAASAHRGDACSSSLSASSVLSCWSGLNCVP
jgi:drug/metabolite transporter (DMT)-like permease